VDVVTHALTAYALARAGLDRLTPQATGLLVAGALLPDADQLLRLAGPVVFLEHQQTFTHSWLLAPVLAALVVVAARWLAPQAWGRSWVAAALGVASHISLDQLSAPGVAAWWPLHAARQAWDLMAPGDFWPALLLSMTITVPFLANLVSSEIGARRDSGRGAAWTALLLVLIYVAVRAQSRDTTLELLHSRVYDGSAARRVEACPDRFDPGRWLGLVDTGAIQRILTVNLRAPFDPEAGETLYPVHHPAIDAARRHDVVARLRDYLKWMHWEAVPASDRVEVTAEELRLGLILRFEVGGRNEVVAASVQPR